MDIFTRMCFSLFYVQQMFNGPILRWEWNWLLKTMVFQEKPLNLPLFLTIVRDTEKLRQLIKTWKFRGEKGKNICAAQLIFHPDGPLLPALKGACCKNHSVETSLCKLEMKGHMEEINRQVLQRWLSG